jgi:WNK lysine deficient protein kinase
MASSRVVDVSPNGNFVRYAEVIGRGSYKIVHKGFDRERGIEVAWSKIALSKLEVDSRLHEQLRREVGLLKVIQCEHVMEMFDAWYDNQKDEFHIITEILLSGSLKDYLKRHGRVSNRVVKLWTKDLLQGLVYLHEQDPPIVHRDVKCDNIFIKGDVGKVKLGDLGLSTLKSRSSMSSVVGTPEFMAEEMFDSEYDERVDVYSLGMCVLEMLTLEYPFAECKTIAQVYRKVMERKPPASLQYVQPLEVKEFIKKCLAPRATRPSAKELLQDPFLQQEHKTHTKALPLMQMPLSSPTTPSNCSCFCFS